MTSLLANKSFTCSLKKKEKNQKPVVLSRRKKVSLHWKVHERLSICLSGDLRTLNPPTHRRRTDSLTVRLNDVASFSFLLVLIFYKMLISMCACKPLQHWCVCVFVRKRKYLFNNVHVDKVRLDSNCPCFSL